ncbi:MAG TPA: cell wall-binding repeat-containing protein, partial [Euzebya sp.]|nr:cell wall-binding repeat-containing protein [Euzebya sp.]
STHLPGTVRREIQRLGASRVILLGDETALSVEVEQQVRDLGLTVDRLAGDNRYATSVAVAQRSAQVGADDGVLWVATGRNWPDTLAAGPAAAHSGGVVLLVDGLDPAGSPATLAHLDQHPPRRGWIAGGPDVVAPTVRVAIERRASGAG